MSDQVVHTSTPTWSTVTPVGNYNNRDGLEGKDASLIHQGNHFLSAQQNAWQAGFGQTAACRDTLESKFDVQRSIMQGGYDNYRYNDRLGIQAERLERENQVAIKLDGEKTRDLMATLDRRRDDREETERRFAKLEASIAAVGAAAKPKAA